MIGYLLGIIQICDRLAYKRSGYCFVAFTASQNTVMTILSKGYDTLRVYKRGALCFKLRSAGVALYVYVVENPDR